VGVYLLATGERKYVIGLAGHTGLSHWVLFAGEVNKDRGIHRGKAAKTRVYLFV
jgi:hypothetical protein